MLRMFNRYFGDSNGISFSMMSSFSDSDPSNDILRHGELHYEGMSCCKASRHAYVLVGVVLFCGQRDATETRLARLDSNALIAFEK